MNKRILSALCFTLAACGSPAKDAAKLAAASAPGAGVAFAVPASLGQISAVAAPQGAVGLSTQVELKFQIACGEKLAAVSYNVRPADNAGVDLLVSAIATRGVALPTAAHCQSIAIVPRTITIPGLLTADKINLVNLSGAPAAVPPTTGALKPIGLELVATRGLCPRGAICEIGGTIVTLKTSAGVGCLDKIAPVTRVATQLADGKVALAVSAIDMRDSRPVGCAALPKTFEVALPMVFTSLDRLQLTVVGG